MALKLGLLTQQILTNHDEVCIPSLSSILLAVVTSYTNIKETENPTHDCILIQSWKLFTLHSVLERI